MTFDQFGLWWLTVFTALNALFAISHVSKGRLNAYVGSVGIVASFLYILFYLHLLGVMK